MKVSYDWLKDYFESDIPDPEKISELLTTHAFEVESVEKRGKDSVLDIKVLPDRAHDCLSHRGIAKEIALLSGAKLKPDVVNLHELDVPESNQLKAEIEDNKLCRRFSFLVIENVEVKASPKWLSERLESIGQRSINNVVDATNYVMFSLGQPIHAYDRELLAEDGGWKILVRGAKKGEKLVALDNKEYSLSEGDPVIVDGVSNKVLGIAGIKGGKASEISAKTKNIIVEAANFNPVSIRLASKKIGLRTDASVRFENEISPELTAFALKAVSDLIFDIAKADDTRVEGIVDIYPRRANQYLIGLSMSDITNILGAKITDKEVGEILDRENFDWRLVDPREEILKVANDAIDTPYKYSASVLYDAPRLFSCSSLVNYAYLKGGIALPRVTIDQYVYGQPIEESDLAPGDVIFSHNSSKSMEEFIFIATGEVVRQSSLHTETFEFMPGTKVEGGVQHNYIYIGDGMLIHASSSKGKVVKEEFKTIKESQHIVGFRRFPAIEEKHFVIALPTERLDLRIKEDMIEEIGRIYGYGNLKSVEISDWSEKVELEKVNFFANKLRKAMCENGYTEVITSAFSAKGKEKLKNPIALDKPYLRESLVGGVSEAKKLNEHNMDLLGLTEVRLYEIGTVFDKSSEHFSLAVAGGSLKDIESILHGYNLKFSEKDGVWEANFSSAVRDLSWDDMPAEFPGGMKNQFTDFSSYPFVLRDIAVFVPEGEDEKEIIETVRKQADDLLASWRLFDTFTKEFPEGKKTSFAYRLAFQSKERTLTDEEVTGIMDKVTKHLNGKSGWQVR